MDFWIQANRPTITKNFDKEDNTLCEAIETVFPMWTEIAFVVWHRIFIPMDYRSDMPVMIWDILDIVEELWSSKQGNFNNHWPSSSFLSSWNMSWKDDLLTIKAKWHCIVGGIEPLLNDKNTIHVDKNEFICEWKRVLGIVINALKCSGYSIEKLPEMKRLIDVYNRISQEGILYRNSGDTKNSANSGDTIRNSLKETKEEEGNDF